MDIPTDSAEAGGVCSEETIRKGSTMIRAENLTYSFPQKDLYRKVSFTLEDGQHCALIGTNGTGKSTLTDILKNPDEYMYDGKLEIDGGCRIGYVSQSMPIDAVESQTVFQYISECFAALQKEIDDICTKMETAEELESLMEQYQNTWDAFCAIDGDHYESNIRKQLKLAGMEKLENQKLSLLSGGEWKLVQVMKEMITSPDLLIMDEPDGFLDFEHLNALKDLINTHKGTMLVITHNRYLLNHCFDKVLHLEDTEIQEFDGRYIDYNFALLQTKIEMQESAAADTEEIERNKKIIEKLRREATIFTSASRGRSLHARVSLVERLEARRIKSPFVAIKQPDIRLVTKNELEDGTVLSVRDYAVGFEDLLLEHVEFELGSRDKVAIVGPNGAGKTTLLRDIYKNDSDSIEIPESVQMAFLSQLPGETLEESHTILEDFLELGFQTEAEVAGYLKGYGFEPESIGGRISQLSGGEKNLLQLAKIAQSDANLLLLDEPTSHLDTYSQVALEQAIADYNGAILMVSHDFYTIANCMDYVLFIDGKTIRKMSIRKFRKMIYANHFNQNYLELEQKKKEIELQIARALKAGAFELAKELLEPLEAVNKQL